MRYKWNLIPDIFNKCQKQHSRHDDFHKSVYCTIIFLPGNQNIPLYLACIITINHANDPACYARLSKSFSLLHITQVFSHILQWGRGAHWALV